MEPNLDNIQSGEEAYKLELLEKAKKETAELDALSVQVKELAKDPKLSGSFLAKRAELIALAKRYSTHGSSQAVQTYAENIATNWNDHSAL